jgi:predicted phage terminase large subunit-like protein
MIKELETLVDNLLKAMIRGHEVPEEPLRLIVMTPPGSAKSTYLSKLFPPWFLAQIERFKRELTAAGRHFEPLGVLSCSHNGTMADEFGRAARNIAEGNSVVLGYNLSHDSRSVDAWSASNGGYYRAASVGSGISGRRMHLGIIDDYCGTEEDATSKLFNDKVWTWWENDFINRLQPISARVIIANHRHEDDLIGRIKAKEQNRWRIVKFCLLIQTPKQEEEDPLGRKVGEYLWPEYFTREQVEERMRNPRASGIQQQEPTPEKGEFFLAETLTTYNLDQLPQDLRYYAASDHAVSMEQNADSTCLILGGVDANDVLWILPDIFWQKAQSDRVVTEMLNAIKRRRPIIWWAEKGHISKSIGPFLRRRMIEERIYGRIDEVTPAKDKQTRAQSIQARMAMGKVRFPQTNWWPAARHELLSFPNGKHDDFVDALAHLGSGLERMTGAYRPAPEPERRLGGTERLTWGWIKESDRQKRAHREFALLDN